MIKENNPGHLRLLLAKAIATHLVMAGLISRVIFRKLFSLLDGETMGCLIFLYLAISAILWTISSNLLTAIGQEAKNDPERRRRILSSIEWIWLITVSLYHLLAFQLCAAELEAYRAIRWAAPWSTLLFMISCSVCLAANGFSNRSGSS